MSKEPHAHKESKPNNEQKSMHEPMNDNEETVAPSEKLWAPRIGFPTSLPITISSGIIYILTLTTIRNPFQHPLMYAIEVPLFLIVLPFSMKWAWSSLRALEKAFPIMDFLDGIEFKWSPLIVSRDRLNERLWPREDSSSTTQGVQVLSVFYSSLVFLLAMIGFIEEPVDLLASQYATQLTIRGLFISVWFFTIMSVMLLAGFFTRAGYSFFSDLGNLSVIQSAQEFELETIKALSKQEKPKFTIANPRNSFADFMHYVNELSPRLKRTSLIAGIVYPFLFIIMFAIPLVDVLPQFYIYAGWLLWIIAIVLIIISMRYIFKIERAIHQSLNEYKKIAVRTYSRLLESLGRQAAQSALQKDAEAPSVEQVEVLKILLDEAKKIDTWTIDFETGLIWVLSIILPAGFTILQIWQSFMQ